MKSIKKKKRNYDLHDKKQKNNKRNGKKKMVVIEEGRKGSWSILLRSTICNGIGNIAQATNDPERIWNDGFSWRLPNSRATNYSPSRRRPRLKGGWS